MIRLALQESSPIDVSIKHDIALYSRSAAKKGLWSSRFKGCDVCDAALWLLTPKGVYPVTDAAVVNAFISKIVLGEDPDYRILSS